MSQQLIVSTYSTQGTVIRREIWDTSSPFGLGYPFRWVLEKSENGIRVWNVKEKQVQEIPENKVSNYLHQLGTDYRISIAKDRRELISQKWHSQTVEPDILQLSHESEIFRKSLIGSVSALAVFIFSAVVISTYFKPKEEALIPPQFARVILKPPTKSGSQGSQRASQSEDAKGAKAVNLVQAFKSTAVQKSTQKLLKGGIISLLAKSNFLPDQKSRAVVSSLFDTSPNRKISSAVTQLTESKAVAVNEMGGQGGGGKGGAVGYGQGQHAGVQGQGSGFVAMNTLDATVEEGLTKDEVGKVIHSHLSEIRYCYESAMIKNPSVEGKLVSDFVIQGSGSVKIAKVNMSNVNDATLDQCIISHLYKWKFPKPRGGVDVAVVYPFIFKSLGK